MRSLEFDEVAEVHYFINSGKIAILNTRDKAAVVQTYKGLSMVEKMQGDKRLLFFSNVDTSSCQFTKVVF